MTPLEARAMVQGRWDVPRGTMDRLDNLVELVTAENSRQNLIARSTLDSIWARHILDSAQLLDYAPAAGPWLDIGTGAGFPGLVVAILRAQPMLLVESRRLRSAFLAEVVHQLGLPAVTVVDQKVEAVATQPVRVISARALAPLEKIFTLAHRFADEDTIWILPKGRSVQQELAVARESWQGSFHVKQSITDCDAAIVVAQAVRPKGK